MHLQIVNTDRFYFFSLSYFFFYRPFGASFWIYSVKNMQCWKNSVEVLSVLYYCSGATWQLRRGGLVLQEDLKWNILMNCISILYYIYSICNNRYLQSPTKWTTDVTKIFYEHLSSLASKTVRTNFSKGWSVYRCFLININVKLCLITSYIKFHGLACFVGLLCT